ncbi:MAG: toll/interleukin-1 receptor domain-containing protein [Myxococcota bacterium]
MTDRYPRLVHAVSFHNSRLQVAFDVVQLLQRQGELDQDFIRQLQAHIPGQNDKIERAYRSYLASRSPPPRDHEHASPADDHGHPPPLPLGDTLRASLIRALADHEVFGDPRALRTMARTALADVDRGPNFLRSAQFGGRPLDVARWVVNEGERLGTPSGDFLARILRTLKMDAVDDHQLIVVNAALERLERSMVSPPGTPPSAPPASHQTYPARPASTSTNHHDGPMVMVSYRTLDAESVRALIDALRAQRVNAVWDQDQPNDSDIPAWVWSTYQHADWIVLACSPAYAQAISGFLVEPSQAPSTGKGVAQEARFMATEHLTQGPGRFVPVLLPGALPDHVPLVARGKFQYRYPDQLHQLAQHVRSPRGSRAPSSQQDDSES